MRKHYVLTTPKQVDVFINDIKIAIDKTRIDFVNEATFSARRYAAWLTPRRLPSRGGGSYGRSHDMRIHHDPPGSMGESIGESYNDHQWAQAVEWGTRPHVQYSRSGGGMKIEDTIPGYYKGRDINTVPYGTKYERKKPPLKVFKVEHPGSRKFLIYTDTFKRLARQVKPILRKAFKRNW